uniref:Peptidase metallopeptidase domain-containing protein n=3 Tax=Timema TaxID=61471 RepID=A0A7R9F546_9NEOP|nr:unnamed protein product [Timema bartmani]
MANRPQCTQSLLNPRPLRFTTRSTSHYTALSLSGWNATKRERRHEGDYLLKQEGERDWRDGIPPAGHCFADGTNLWDTGLIMRDYSAGRTATKLNLDSPPSYRDRERLQFEMLVPLSDVTQLPLLLARVNASSLVWKPMGHSVYSAGDRPRDSSHDEPPQVWRQRQGWIRHRFAQQEIRAARVENNSNNNILNKPSRTLNPDPFANRQTSPDKINALFDVPTGAAHQLRLLKEELGFIKEELDFLKEGLGFLKEGLGFLKEELGFLKKKLEFKEELGFLKEELGFLKEGLGFLKEELGFLKEELGFLKEGQDFLKEELRFLKEELGFLKEELVFKEDLRFHTEELTGMSHNYPIGSTAEDGEIEARYRSGSRWRVKALTYRISKYPSTSRLNKEDVDKELNNAFNVWAGVTDLSFTQKDSGQVHIEIRFEKGEHGDGDPFDGPGGTLAHAYFPVYGGDAHFDDAETWTIQSYRDLEDLYPHFRGESGKPFRKNHPRYIRPRLEPVSPRLWQPVYYESDTLDRSTTDAGYTEVPRDHELSLCLPGTNLFQVAAHEFGHSLGLSHSDVKSALMAPFYRGYEPIFKLDQDDVQGIQVGILAHRYRLPAIHETDCLLEHPRLTPNSGESEQSPTWIPTPQSYDVTKLMPGALLSAVQSSCFPLASSGLRGALYGKKSKGGSDDHTTSSTTEQSGRDGEGVNSEEDPILCKDGSVDTMFNSAEGVTYVFKVDRQIRQDDTNSFCPHLHWCRLNTKGVFSALDCNNSELLILLCLTGWPPTTSRLITRSWKGLPGNMDAAFTYRNGKTYFFKGDQYWRYIGKKMDGEYPKPISEGFTGIPDNLDAAMVWGGNGKIYFYKGSKFWRFDPSQRPPVKSTYPKPISNWEGIPDNVDAALQYTNGYTYFFKGNAYYRFNDRTFAVDTADPAFPRSAGHWWFGCTTQTSGTYKPGNRPGFSWYTHSGEDEGAAAVDNNEQRDRADSHDSDVDDLILDAGRTSHGAAVSNPYWLLCKQHHLPQGQRRRYLFGPVPRHSTRPEKSYQQLVQKPSGLRAALSDESRRTGSTVAVEVNTRAL